MSDVGEERDEERGKTRREERGAKRMDEKRSVMNFI